MNKKPEEPALLSTEEQFYNAFKTIRPGFKFLLRDGTYCYGSVERAGRYTIRIKEIQGKASPDVKPKTLLLYKHAIISVEPLPME